MITINYNSTSSSLKKTQLGVETLSVLLLTVIL